MTKKEQREQARRIREALGTAKTETMRALAIAKEHSMPVFRLNRLCGQIEATQHYFAQKEVA